MTHTKQLCKQKLQNAWENLTNSIAKHNVPSCSILLVVLKNLWDAKGTLVWTAEEEHET